MWYDQSFNTLMCIEKSRMLDGPFFFLLFSLVIHVCVEHRFSVSILGQVPVSTLTIHLLLTGIPNSD